MGKRGPKPKGMVDCTWRPELAYCLGLLTSDGCLSGDGRHIDLTSKDKEQVLSFQHALGLYHIKVGRKTSGSTEGKKYYRIQFGDVLFYQWLQGVGLSPNKSKSISAVQIPDEYFFDFFRGLFDGDGSVGAFWDTRWRSSYAYWIRVASASPIFLVWLQAECLRLGGAYGSIVDGVRVQEIRFVKRATRTLVSLMYQSDDVPCLHRKFAKLQKIFSIDDTNNAQVEEMVDSLP